LRHYTEAFENIAELFDVAFSLKHETLVRGCSVLVGLHPDQATNDIVAGALLTLF